MAVPENQIFEDARKQLEKFSLMFFKLQSIAILAIYSQTHLLTVSVQ